MSRFLLLFAIGVFGVSLLPALPPLWLPCLLLAVSLCCCRYRAGRLSAGCCAGLCWGVLCGQQLLHHQLPAELELQELVVRGEVVGLPNRDQRRSRFLFQVQSCREVNGQRQLPLHRLLLSWYGTDMDLQPGQQWQFRVKLRRPRGFANPGAFDYQLWLLRQGISATGYIRSSSDNSLLARHRRWPHSARFYLSEQLQQLPAPERRKALLQALVVGDGSALSAADWQLFNRTGTAHLMVISGLHIGFFALFCYGVGTLLGRLVNLLQPALPTALVASCCALLGALCYAGLSGFGLPATRALTMVAVVVGARLLRSHIAAGQGLLVALAVIALFDPLAVHSAGFWLSFGAVFGLLWVFAPSIGGGRQRRWQQWWRPQWVVFAALSALLLAAFGRLPLLSVPINSLAIPWVSLVIVPLCLLGVAISPASITLAGFCWQLAGWQLQVLYELLHWLDAFLKDGLASLGGANLSLPAPMSFPLLLALWCGALLLLLPKGLPGRWLGALPFVLALFAVPARPPLAVAVLDVGQGLAVVVTTPGRTLVYDTGAAFGRRFDVGSALVAPFLRAQGIHRVDRLVISHADGDHAGGLGGLLRSMDVADIWSGEPLPEAPRATTCRAGMQWHWDNVQFQVLSPLAGQQLEGNNSSCVLLISYGSRRLLLPGDIEASQERRLLANGLAKAAGSALDILLAPHHGSRTSSTAPFVFSLSPAHVIYSAGYLHHFGHPHSVVIDRYQRVGSRQWNTADSGALLLELRAGRWQVSEHRRQQGYFWQRQLRRF